MPDLLAAIDLTPSPIAIQLGPLPLYWYGVAYAVGLLVAYLAMSRQVRRYAQNPEHLANGMIVIGVAALVGGRLYHVIDQWQLYKDDLLKIVLPPYSGLGVYGGMVTGLIAFAFLVRRWRLDGWTWADVMAPGIFAMQGIGRWGNFFNQELYGPPTDLPWGIAIDCAHRVAPYTCDAFPAATYFQPLFLYESISGLVGMLVLLWLASKPRPWLRRGDLLLILFIWYPTVRFVLEGLRTGNWRLVGIPTAEIFSVAFALVSLGLLIYRHRTAPPGAIVGVPPGGDPPSGDPAPAADRAAAVDPAGVPSAPATAASGEGSTAEPTAGSAEPTTGSLGSQT